MTISYEIEQAMKCSSLAHLALLNGDIKLAEKDLKAALEHIENYREEQYEE